MEISSAPAAYLRESLAARLGQHMLVARLELLPAYPLDLLIPGLSIIS
jgi:hypothetical protein